MSYMPSARFERKTVVGKVNQEKRLNWLNSNTAMLGFFNENNAVSQDV